MKEHMKYYKEIMTENPYMRFGIGVDGYFRILTTLIYLFIFLSVLSMLQIWVFSTRKFEDEYEYPWYRLDNPNYMMSVFNFAKP